MILEYDLESLEWVEEPYLNGTLYRIYLPFTEREWLTTNIDRSYRDVWIKGRTETKQFTLASTRDAWSLCYSAGQSVLSYGWPDEYTETLRTSKKFYCLDLKP